ncbi:hypothetical protein JW916_00080 [Candidatus Sumerlaeota bacterium]|nr:hypothetical protein [Candidatus Sumerlaeota bacterium]
MTRTSADAWKRLALIVVLVLVALGARLALFNPDSNLSPDAADYVNIARNLAEGRGFVHSIKWHFFTNDPVVRPAAGERPPLYPLLLGVVWRLGGRMAAIDGVNVFLGVAAIIVLFLLYERVLDWRCPAFVAALLAAINPSVAKACVFPWTEPLFLLLHASALLVLIAGIQSEGSRLGSSAAQSSSRPDRLERPDWLALAAGVLAALAYLARPNGVVLLVAVLGVLALARRWRTLGLFLLPNALILGVWFAVVWMQKGSPFFSVQEHHFRVLRIEEGMRAGWGAAIPSREEFAAANPLGSLVVENAWRYTLDLLGRPFLGLPIGEGYALSRRVGTALLFVSSCLGAAVPIVWTLRRLGGRGTLLGLCALGHFLLISLVWATHEGDRFLQPVYLFLVPLVVGVLFDGARHAARRRPSVAVRWTVWSVVLAVLLSWAGVGVRNLILTRAALRQLPSFHSVDAQEREQIDSLLPEGAIVATDAPFMANWLLDRPTVYLPTALTHLNAEGFFREYDVSVVVPLDLRDAMLRAQVSTLVRTGRIRPLRGHLLPGLTWFAVTTGPTPPASGEAPVNAVDTPQD